MRAHVDYTVYLAKTSLPVAFGSPAVCARTLGMPIGSFRSMVTRSMKGENKKYIVVKENVPDSGTTEAEDA